MDGETEAIAYDRTQLVDDVVPGELLDGLTVYLVSKLEEVVTVIDPKQLEGRLGVEKRGPGRSFLRSVGGTGNP